jgi:hypothetical protein
LVKGFDQGEGMATTYQNSFSGAGRLTFQSLSHPVYDVTVNGTTTANVTFSADQTTFTATETSSATAHFHVFSDSTGGFQDFDRTENDTETLSGPVNNVIGLLINTSDAHANFTGAFNSDLSSITGNATVTFDGFDGSVPVPITLPKKNQLVSAISFDHYTASLDEGGTAGYVLKRSFVPIGDEGASVLVSTQDGTGRAGFNYEPMSVRVFFGPGATTAVVPNGVKTIDNNVFENNPTFHVLLTDPSPNARIELSEADTTIIDNDALPAPFPTLPFGTLVIPENWAGIYNLPDDATLAANLARQVITVQASFGSRSFYTGLHAVLFKGGAGTDHVFVMSGGNTFTAGTGTTIVDYSLATGGTTINLVNGRSAGSESGAFPGNDVLNNIHNVIGSPFDDTFGGSTVADTFAGGAGNDKFTAGLGNDTIDGGPGIDTAVYSGLRSAYTITLRADGSVQVSGPDGVDIVTNVELLNFADGTVQAPKPPHWMASTDIGPHPAGWLPLSTADYNHDGTSDVLWFNSTTRDLDLWKISNGHWAGSVDIGTHPAGYAPAGSGDFNHDGTADMLWYNATTRDLDLWKISNGQWAGSVDVGSHPAGWQPLGSGDFNGDGTSDVIWYNPATNDTEIWKIQNGGWAGSVEIGTHPVGWQPISSADFTGDGTGDVLWYNPTTRDVELWKISDGHWAGSIDIGTHPAGSAPVGVGDFNRDGTADIVWFNATSGDTELWMIQDGHWAASVDLGTHPAGWTPASVGDFDHNGVSDILWRETATNHVEAWLLSNS